MARGNRVNVDPSSLLGSNGTDGSSSADHHDLEGSHATGESPSDGSLASFKSWWADPTRRRYLLGGLCCVIAFLVIVGAVAVITKEESSKGGGGDGGGSSTGGAPPLPPYNPETPWLFPRLPNSTTAPNYAIALTFDVDRYVFNGSETVTLTTNRPVDHLLLHSVAMTWSGITLTLDSGAQVAVVPWQFGQYLVLNLSSTIAPQSAAKLFIAFAGQLVRGQQSGSYPGWYTNDDGTETLLVSTQFESTSARRAFPCLDEPALKSTFDVTITNAPKYPTVLSNQKQITRTIGPNGWLTTSYATTPIMSTYLVAWVVSDYINTTRVTQCLGKDVRTSVWVPAYLKNSSIVSAYLAAEQIAFYCSYFNLPYPMEKEDHVYIPQFSAGAMENWGLITYRDYAILWDPAINTIVQLQRMAMVIAHELAHMWTGDIVTASWWSQLWLNEGFARFYQFVAGNAVSPELMLVDQFITVAQRQALVTDSGRNTIPVADDNRNAGGNSDIIYAKGASVLRMIQALIGDSVFHAGINAYLFQFQYSTATTQDLFRVLDRTVAQNGGKTNVTEIMHEWCFQAGYPLVTCDARTQTDGSQVWTCSQQRYYSYNEANPAPSTWTIPLTLTLPSPAPTSTNLVWPPGQTTFTFTLSSTPAFVKINTNTTGFYRVQYSPAQWTALSKALNQPGFSGILHDDRLGLVNDAYAFLDKGLLRPQDVLNISLFLQHDTSFTVWAVATPSLLALWDRVKYTNDTGRVALYAYMQQLMGGVALRMNISRRNTIADEMLENTLATAIAKFNLGRRSQLLLIYNQLATHQIDILTPPANLIDLVLQSGMAATTGNVFASYVYLDLYKNKTASGSTRGSNPNDPYAALGYSNVLTALTSTTDMDSLSQLLDRAADPQWFRRQDAAEVIRLVAANDYGLGPFNDHITNPTWFTLWNATLTSAEFGTTLQYALGLHSWPSIIDGLDSFLSRQPVAPTVRVSINAGLAQARTNAAWMSAYYPAMSAWLTSYAWIRSTEAVLEV